MKKMKKLLALLLVLSMLMSFLPVGALAEELDGDPGTSEQQDLGGGSGGDTMEDPDSDAGGDGGTDTLNADEGTDTDADADINAGGDTDTDADDGSDTDTDADANAGGDTDTDADANAGGDTDTDNDTNADGDTDTDADADANAGGGTDTDADADANAGGDTDTDADADANAGGDTDTDTDADANVGGDTDTDTDNDVNADSDSDTDTDADANAGDGSDDDTTDDTNTGEGTEDDGSAEDEELQVEDPNAASEDAALAEAEEAAAVDEGRGLTYVEAPSTSGDPLYKILHLDAGRKYTSLTTLKQVVDYVAFNGMNQINLYLSDNQGLRFAPLNAEGKFVVEANGTSYDLTEALGYYENTREPSKSTDSIDKWLTPAEMKELILYAADKGVDIVPCINMPGHMAAILQGSGDERVSAFGKTFAVNSGDYLSNESLDMGNVEAVNFTLALLEAYCNYFNGIEDSAGNKLVNYFCIGGDEYGQDLLYNAWDGSGFGTAYMNAKDEYDDLVNFLNRCGNVIKGYGMTPRAFNDPFLSDGNTDAEELGLNTDYQLYYWGGGWGGMINASPEVLDKAGFDVINCNSNYYYICCQNRPYKSYIDTVAGIEANPFELKTFATGTVSFEPAGAMFCIWCDHCTGGSSHETNIAGEAMEVMAAWAACLVEVPVTIPQPEKNTLTENGVTVTGNGLSGITVTETTAPEITGADTNKIKAYIVSTTTTQGDTSISYTISIDIPEGWENVKGFSVGSLARGVMLPVNALEGTVSNGEFTFTTTSSYGTYGIYAEAAASEGTTTVNVSLSVGESYDFGVLSGDYTSQVGTFENYTLTQTSYSQGEAAATVTPDQVTSGTAYLIGDADGNYLTINSSALENTTETASATKWTVTKREDGTYTFSSGSYYLTVTNGVLALTTNPSGETSGDSSGGTTGGNYPAWGEGNTYALGDIVYYDGKVYECTFAHSGSHIGWAPGVAGTLWKERTDLTYVPDSDDSDDSGDDAAAPETAYWSYDETNGYSIIRGETHYYLSYSDGWKVATAAGSKKGEPYKLGTSAQTGLKLEATKSGTVSLTFGSTTYNFTIIAEKSGVACNDMGIKISGYGVNSVACQTASVTAITGYDMVASEDIFAHTLTPQVESQSSEGAVTEVYTGEVEVLVPLNNATGLSDWAISGRIIKAFYQATTGETVVVDAAVTTVDGTAAVTFKTPGGTVTSGVFLLPADYYTGEVTYYVGDGGETKSVVVTGEYDTGDLFFVANEGETAAEAQERVERIFTTALEVTTAHEDYQPPQIVSAITVGTGYYIASAMEDNSLVYMTYDTTNGIGYTTDIDAATLFADAQDDSYLGLKPDGDHVIVYSGGSFQISSPVGDTGILVENIGEGIVGKNSNDYLCYDSETKTWGIGTASSSGKAYVYSQAKAEVDAKTTITFTGVTVGEASVIIGTTKYNIIVRDKDLLNNRVTIYSMISNNLVKIGENSSGAVCHVDVSAVMAGVNTAEGIDLTTLFPTSAVRAEDEMVFWKMTWLPYGHWQNSETGTPYITSNTTYPGPYTGVGGDGGDKTGKFNYEYRVDFTKLRYYDATDDETSNPRWEFYLDSSMDSWYTGEAWGDGWYPVNPDATDVADMPGATVGSGQIIAYYLQVTDVTQEVITNVADWGPSITTNNTYGSEYVLLDFAVRYEGGTRNPSETGTFPIVDKTMTFHCISGWGSVEPIDGTLHRTVNAIQATTDEIHGYEIYMITTTKSTETLAGTSAANKRDSDGTGGYDYDTSTETIVWLKDENVAYDSDTYDVADNVAYGTREEGAHTNGVPYLDSVTIQSQTGLLVTYYVRYVGHTEDDLHVYYHNLSLSEDPELNTFYDYAIRVKSGTLFDSTFAIQNVADFELTGNEVENYYDVTQIIQGDPRNIIDAALPSFYRSVELTLVDVDLNEDRKEAHLYYNTNNAKDMVIDFGQPVEVTTTSMQINLDSDEELIGITGDSALFDESNKYYAEEGEYGYFVTDFDTSGESWSGSGRMFYIPTKVMRSQEHSLQDNYLDAFHLQVSTNKHGSSNPHRYFLTIYPATTMYYEEYFADYSGSWNGGTMPALNTLFANALNSGKAQESAYPGMSGANNYGYDEVYNGRVTESVAQTKTVGDKLTFEFTGDGVDIYAKCTAKTGTAMVALYSVSGGSESLKSIYLVDTIRKDGDYAATQGQASGDSYDTPIVSLRDLGYGDYKVKITLTNYGTAYKTYGDEFDGFLFDGFRVFNTLGSSVNNTVYNEDRESNPEFVEIRDSVMVAAIPTVSTDSIYASQIAAKVESQVYNLASDSRVSAILMASSSDVLTSDAIETDYLDNGPKNEVYIYAGQTLTITMHGTGTAAKTQVGMKTLSGTATLDSITLCQTNMYYPTDGSDGNFRVSIDTEKNTSTITIINAGTGIISVTDLKVPGGLPAAVSATGYDVRGTVSNTLMLMGYTNEPEETEPETTEPKVTEPEETEPKETEPKETEPKETEPKETVPKETEPKETKPKETKPSSSDTKKENDSKKDNSSNKDSTSKKDNSSSKDSSSNKDNSSNKTSNSNKTGSTSNKAGSTSNKTSASTTKADSDSTAVTEAEETIRTEEEILLQAPAETAAQENEEEEEILFAEAEETPDEETSGGVSTLLTVLVIVMIASLAALVGLLIYKKRHGID